MFPASTVYLPHEVRLAVDSTECPVEDHRQEVYSGKKKDTTFKYQTLTDLNSGRLS